MRFSIHILRMEGQEDREKNPIVRLLRRGQFCGFCYGLMQQHETELSAYLKDLMMKAFGPVAEQISESRILGTVLVGSNFLKPNTAIHLVSKLGPREDTRLNHLSCHSVKTLCGISTLGFFQRLDSLFSSLPAVGGRGRGKNSILRLFSGRLLCGRCYRILQGTEAGLAEGLQNLIDEGGGGDSQRRHSRLRRARRKNMAFPERMVEEAFKEALGRCLLCSAALVWERRGRGSAAPTWQAHHIDGENASRDNLAILCARCHMMITNESMRGGQRVAFFAPTYAEVKGTPGGPEQFARAQESREQNHRKWVERLRTALKKSRQRGF